jgi:predicted cation transporter
MTLLGAALILTLILLGPLAVQALERNLEAYCVILGVIAVTLSGQWNRPLLAQMASAAAPITLAVVVAGLAFARFRPALERGFARLREAISRPLLTGIAIIAIGLASCLISAIVGALVLVEAIGMLRLGPPARNNVAVAGCFAIGLGSALTPAGGPFSAIVAHGLDLRFFDLWRLLGAWLIPGTALSGVIAGWFARGDYDFIAEETAVRERARDVVFQGAKIFAFVAGLTLIGAAYGPLAARWTPRLGPYLLFWGNTLSAALDNATLAALEAHGMTPVRLRPALLSMVISGGMLIPGNIPNIVCAGILEIRSVEWARVGVPIGLAMLGICFALLFATQCSGGA